MTVRARWTRVFTLVHSLTGSLAFLKPSPDFMQVANMSFSTKTIEEHLQIYTRLNSQLKLLFLLICALQPVQPFMFVCTFNVHLSRSGRIKKAFIGHSMLVSSDNGIKS